MKKAEVELGKVYRVKVSGKLADVRIESKRISTSYNGRERTCWYGVNLATGREIYIRSAAKLRREVNAEERQKTGGTN